MPYQYVLYEKKGRIAYVTINRPEARNALHLPAHQELWEIWCDFRDDPDVWIAILTGAGDKAFSAGQDLKYLPDVASQGLSLAELLPPGGFAGITNRFECWKPIIAAVNGYAVGGGCETALACDIIVAAENARFGLTEPRVGIMAGAGGLQRLPRQVPLKIAMGMILTGRQITAQEAYRIGLVNEVVPLSELMPAAERWAEEILECAPLMVRASKRVAMTSLEIPLDRAMNNQLYALEMFQQMFGSEDAMEGPRAFAEKRKPVWKGK